MRDFPDNGLSVEQKRRLTELDFDQVRETLERLVASNIEVQREGGPELERLTGMALALRVVATVGAREMLLVVAIDQLAQERMAHGVE